MIGRLHMLIGIEDETVTLIEQSPPESHLIILTRRLDLQYHRDVHTLDIIQDRRTCTASPDRGVDRKMFSVQITAAEIPESEESSRPIRFMSLVKNYKMKSCIG